VIVSLPFRSEPGEPEAAIVWTTTRAVASAIIFAGSNRPKGSTAMPINALHHVTVKTDDLDATRDFYQEILGLEVGFRPDLDFPGYWLYCGPTPVVHLVPRENAIGGGPSHDTGPFDHFAFLASDFDGIKARLEQKKIKYRENHIAAPPIDQLFFPDNNNVMVELNFPRS
jgi:catechol 2,3-dioxygenase-like lactoylglutathione lyase family enzyme